MEQLLTLWSERWPTGHRAQQPIWTPPQHCGKKQTNKPPTPNEDAVVVPLSSWASQSD